MLSDPLHAIAALSAIYVLGCVASFFVGRWYQRRHYSAFQRAVDTCRERRPLMPSAAGVHTGPPPAFRSQRPLFQRR